MLERQFTPLDIQNLSVEKGFISTFDIHSIGAEALLFQSGYLTISGEQKVGSKTIYNLDYPNLEVRESLNEGYLEYLLATVTPLPEEPWQLVRKLVQQDFDGFATALRALFDSITYTWHQFSQMANDEGWYCSLLYSCLLIGNEVEIKVYPEQSTSRGRSDLMAEMGDQVNVMECKKRTKGDDTANKAVAAVRQIKARGYADHYRSLDKTIHLIGLVFDGDKRTLTTMKVEQH